MPGIRIRKSGGNAVVANGIINVVNSATISGSALVCGSSASFDLQNQPIGSSITWVIKQNGINKAQGSGTHASSLNLSNGSGNISYTMNFNCGPNSPQVLSKDFWVGIPAVTISGPSEGYLGNSYTFYEYPVGNSYASSFNWTLTPEFSGNNIYNYGYWASAAFYGSSGYYQVSCIPTNLCGTGSMATSYIEIYETLGLTISPNPASSEVTVRIDQNIINQNENDLNELNFEVIIYNAFGVIQSRKEYSGLTFIIPVGYFNDGNYIIKFDNGKSVITKQLIIKH